MQLGNTIIAEVLEVFSSQRRSDKVICIKYQIVELAKESLQIDLL